MNMGASDIIANSFLTGSVDVLDALMSRHFSYTINEIVPLRPATFGALAAGNPVCLSANVVGGGGVCLLMRTQDASWFSSLTLSGEGQSKDVLSDEDLGTLKEIATAILGSGIANITQQFDIEAELESHSVTASVDSAALESLIGDAGTQVSFDLSSGDDFKADALLLFAEDLEGLIPAAAADTKSSMSEGPTLSESEMSDILSGFAPEGGAGIGHGVMPSGEAPRNLNMILDIQLTVTARLGNVEMPLAEILELGAGSIIEVGHLVDEPIELLVNEKLIARGDVVVVDEKFGLRITEIISQQDRIESLR